MSVILHHLHLSELCSPVITMTVVPMCYKFKQVDFDFLRNPALDNCCPPLWTAHREVWAKVVSHPAFEGFILFLIAASSITLCFEVSYN